MPQKTSFKLQSKKKTSNKESWRIQDMLAFPCTDYAMPKNHSRNITRYEIHLLTLNVLKSRSTRMHWRSNFLPWLLCVEMVSKWSKDPSPLPWMTTMAWRSPMARPCKTLSVLKLHWKRSNLPSKMKIIVIMAIIATIYHNNNVCLSNDDFWRHSNDAGHDFLVQQKNRQSNLPSVRSAMSALPLKGAQSLEHRVTIYLTVRNKTITGKIYPEEQTNQGIKGLQYPIIFLRILFVGPQDQLQWSEKSDVRFNNFQRGTGRAFQSPVVTAFVVPASFDP